MNVETWLPVLATVVIVGVIVLVVKEGSGAVEKVNSDADATIDAPALSGTARGDNWRPTGWAFAALGSLGLVLSLFMKTSVATSGLYGAASEVVNLDLQFHKGLAIAGSLFAIGLGVFCLGIAAVVKAISQTSRPQ